MATVAGTTVERTLFKGLVWIGILLNTGYPRGQNIDSLRMRIAGRMFPTPVRLALTDPAGKSRELKFSDPRVAGRVDDFTVALGRGAMYAFPVSLDQQVALSAR